MPRRVSKKALVASARAVIPTFEVIAYICGLESYDGWSKWHDPEGNKLTINKNGHILIRQTKNLICKTNDIFIKAHPSLIAKYSYWVLVMFGNERSLICFLGNDGLLRCCYFIDGKWVKNICPLLCGNDVLQLVAKHYLDISIREVEAPGLLFDKNVFCQTAWMSGYPITENEDLKRKLDWHLTV